MQRSFLNPIEDVNGLDKNKMNLVRRPLDKAMVDRLSIQRKNFLCVCKMTVKSIVDKSPFEAILDDCPYLNNLCTILEHIFTHKMQVRWSIFGTNQDSVSFWHLFQTFSHPNTVTSVEDMENINSDIGKCRVWLRLALVQKRLSSFMNSLLSKQCDLKNMYMPGAFLLSSELVELAGTLQCLDAIDFNLCLKDVASFDNVEVQEISYSPYLKFKQSDISKMDDLKEEHKLSSSHHNAPGVGGGVVRSRPTIEEESISQLVELLKTEKEQKNYFEELVSVRDSQLAKLQKDVDLLTRENEEQRKEMDALVIELQQNISSLQSELQQMKVSRTGSAASSNRRSGLFTGIFGGTNET